MTEKSTETEPRTGREPSDLSDLLCAAPFFDMSKLKTSPYPADFVPKDSEPFVFGVDSGAPGGDCCVRGFYKDGEIHVQEIACTQRPCSKARACERPLELLVNF